jgi:fatty acid amide hydrolase 2
MSPIDPLLSAPALSLAQMIRRRKVSSLEVVDAHIARIERINGTINALIADRFEAARAEARAADERVAQARDPDELPPLHGVPCSIKEFLEVEGMPNTGGLLARREVRARADCTVVERLRRAGAIVLGVTNVPEGGMWMETHNKIWGRTSNPWDPRRTAGGSSGGEAALVAAGGSPFGIGSDIAGSIRIPAAFCGVVGHKPTGRMVPNTGHWGGDDETSRFLTSGPIGRCVRDLAAVLSIIAGPDGKDPLTQPWESAPWQGDLSSVVVYPVEVTGGARVSAVMRREVRRAADALAARGAQVRAPDAIIMGRIFPMWARAMTEGNGGGASFAEVLGDGVPIDLRRELALTLVGRASVTVPALGLALLERLSARLPARLSARVPQVATLQAELEAALGPNGVILHPPYTRPAPVHNAPLLTPFDFVCTSVFNILEFPATVVPTGFDRRGLPVGVQVAARRGRDALTLAVAAALEQDFGGWRPAMA